MISTTERLARRPNLESRQPGQMGQPGQPAIRARAGKLSSVLIAASLLGCTLLTACAPLVLGGAMVGSVLMASDRRTSGTQLEDQGIELKAAARVRSAVAERGHINVTSYNRAVLLTGEVPASPTKRPSSKASGPLRTSDPCSTSWPWWAPAP